MELRFTPKANSVVSILPGFLFSRLSKQYAKHLTLPLATLPPELRSQNPALRYTQQIRLLSEDVYSLFVGDQVAGASAVSPYPGWESFRPRVLDLVIALKESDLIKEMERVSFKYVNVLPVPRGKRLQALKVSVAVSGEPVAEEGFTLRTEQNDRNYLRITEVATSASITRASGEKNEGLLLSLDAVSPLAPGTGPDRITPELIDAVHLEAKKLFFRLLTEDTLASLGPEYEAKS